MDLCEFEATLGYTDRICLKEKQGSHKGDSRHLRSYAFNPSTREVEIGATGLGGERNIKGEEAGTQWSVESEVVESIAESRLCLSELW